MLVQRKESKDVTEGMADLLVLVDTAPAVVGVVQTEVEIMQMLALWRREIRNYSQKNYHLLVSRYGTSC